MSVSVPCCALGVFLLDVCTYGSLGAKTEKVPPEVVPQQKDEALRTSHPGPKKIKIPTSSKDGQGKPTRKERAIKGWATLGGGAQLQLLLDTATCSRGTPPTPLATEWRVLSGMEMLEKLRLRFTLMANSVHLATPGLLAYEMLTKVLVINCVQCHRAYPRRVARASSTAGCWRPRKIKISKEDTRTHLVIPGPADDTLNVVHRVSRV